MLTVMTNLLLILLLLVGCSLSSKKYSAPELVCNEYGYCDAAPGLKEPYKIEEYGIDILVKEEQVIIACFIDKNGNPKYCKVQLTSGIEKIDSIALKAMKKSKWYPAIQENTKVGVWMSVPFKFSGL